MKAGRKLDALIAEKVMGYINIFWQDDVPYGSTESVMTGTVLPFYSRDISDAFKVVEEMRKRCCCLSIRHPQCEPIECEMVPDYYVNPEHKSFWGHSDESAAHAICLAALEVANAIGN